MHPFRWLTFALLLACTPTDDGVGSASGELALGAETVDFTNALVFDEVIDSTTVRVLWLTDDGRGFTCANATLGTTTDRPRRYALARWREDVADRVAVSLIEPLAGVEGGVPLTGFEDGSATFDDPDRTVGTLRIDVATVAFAAEDCGTITP